MKAFPLLEALEGFGTKRAAKISYMEVNASNEDLQKAFKAAYDWKVTYGVRVPPYEPGAQNVRETPLFGAATKVTDPWKTFCTLLDDYAGRNLTGNAARDAWKTLMSACSELERKWFTRILNRDLRIGVDRKTIAEVWPNLIEPWGVQLANELKPDKVTIGVPTTKERWLGWPVYVEPKLDGLRTIIDYNAATKTAQAFSREGHYFGNLQSIMDKMAAHLGSIKAPTCRIDSEAFATGWNSTVAFLKKEDINDDERAAALKFHCFDMITSIPDDKTPLHDRHNKLVEVLLGAPLSFVLVHQYVVDSMERLMDVYNECLDAGHEGVMVKFTEAPYRAKRSNAWLKLKPTQTVDAEIIGFEPGKPGTKNAKRLGAFVVRRGDTGATVRVGGGFSDAQRDSFWDMREDLRGTILEFKEQGERGSVGVAAFPRFVRLRVDRERL